MCEIEDKTSQVDNHQISMFDNTPQSTLNRSIELLRDFEHTALLYDPRGYAVGYSGGKDSDALVRLFQMAGVKFFISHSHTTLDAPETVYYVRKKFAEWSGQGILCYLNKPEKNFWQICEEHSMLPTRRARFCCATLKEREYPTFAGCVKSFGVRKAESVKRAQYRDSVEINRRKDMSDMLRFGFDNLEESKEYIREGGSCDFRKTKCAVNPMVYWSNEFLKEFIEGENIEINPLYKEGFKRVGCVGCPLGVHRIEELERYPKFRDRFIQLCDKIVEKQKQENKIRPIWGGGKTGTDYFLVWLSDLPEEEYLKRRDGNYDDLTKLENQ